MDFRKQRLGIFYVNSIFLDFLYLRSMILVMLLTFEWILPLRVLLFERLLLLLLIPVTIKLYFSVKRTKRNTTVPTQVLRVERWMESVFSTFVQWPKAKLSSLEFLLSQIFVCIKSHYSMSKNAWSKWVPTYIKASEFFSYSAKSSTSNR